MDYRLITRQLLDEWFRYSSNRSYASSDNVVDIQLQKEACANLVYRLDQEYAWGNDPDNLQHLCEELAPRLEKFKQAVVFGILKRP